MNTLFVFLQSAQAEAGGAGVMNIIMIVLLVVVFWLFMIRPQQKRQKETRKMREALGKGDKVVTAGGIHGRIISVNANLVEVEVCQGVRLTVDKNSIYAVGTQDAAQQEAIKQ